MSQEHIKTCLPVTLDNISSDATMAAKYFLDICNDGSPAMVDEMRKMLKAMWLRLVVKEEANSNVAMAEALASWYSHLTGKDLYKQDAVPRLTKG